MATNLNIREVKQSEIQSFGKLLVEVYTKLDGFPTQIEQPDYYETLNNIGSLSDDRNTKFLVATSAEKILIGGVVYFGDMSKYGSGGIATKERNTSGIRFLWVDPEFTGMGIGKALTNACIQLAVDRGHDQVILHTTQAMQVAWGLYSSIGFERSADLDFSPGDFTVFGFRLSLTNR